MTMATKNTSMLSAISEDAACGSARSQVLLISVVSVSMRVRSRDFIASSRLVRRVTISSSFAAGSTSRL